MKELLAESPASVAEVMMQRALIALESCSESAPIEEAYVVVGELSWDQCCGLLSGIPLRTFRTEQFPLPTADATNCDAALLAVDIAVVLLRCVPTIDEQGNVPTVDAMSQAFAAASRDAALVWDAMLGELPAGWERANLEQTFDGADGGCIAIDTRLTIGLPQSDWCVDCG